MKMNQALVRLVCCCGLRASEIAGLHLADVRLGIARPHQVVRAETAKLGRARRVPLWWDAGTLADLTAWKAHREAQGARMADPFLCGQHPSARGESLNRHVLRRRFLTACGALGYPRLRSLTLHRGRHTFISHALAGGRTLAEVKAAAGHSSLHTTSAYLQVLEDVGRWETSSRSRKTP